MLKTDFLSGAQIIVKNPVLSSDKSELYLEYLRKYMKQVKWQNRKNVRAHLNLYCKIVGVEKKRGNIKKKIFDEELGKYKFLLPFDIVHMIGFDEKLLQSDELDEMFRLMKSDLGKNQGEQDTFQLIFDLLRNKTGDWKKLKKRKDVEDFQSYLDDIKLNFDFIKERPYKILVTATMSAGKSTFINSITGKTVNLSQNMACTSKIHSIIGKTFEDGYSYEYDHDLELDADLDLLMDDNELNNSNKIFVSTYFNSDLAGKRIVLVDSPGVNFSENEEHREISKRIIKAKDYELIIYLINATQIGTNDDDEHLEYVRSILGRKPILFVVNKVDAFDSAEEDVSGILKELTDYLEKKGFQNPQVCPVSSWAGCLAKKAQSEELKRLERRQMDALYDKFTEIKLSEYYKKNFPEIVIKSSRNESKQLLRNCGTRYVEQIINSYYENRRK